MGGHVNAAMTRWKLLALLVLHLAALGLFVNGYLLTRIHLQEKSTQSTEALCSQPYKKLVWIVIDALRWAMYKSVLRCGAGLGSSLV